MTTTIHKSSADVIYPEFPNTNQKKSSFDAQRFAWIERVLLDHNIPPLARCVAVRIGTKYLNPISGDAWPAQDTLAAELGVTIRAIQKSLDRLVGASHLHREVPSTTLGRGHTNHYRPEYGALRANAGSPIGAQEGRTAEHGRANGCAKKGEPPFVQSFLRDPSKENHLKEDIYGAIDSVSVSAMEPMAADFETFWQLYPRKKAKDEAAKTYAAILKSGRATAAELLAGAGRYAAAMARQEPRFIKHPAKWLNGGCWTDEPEPSSGLAKPGSAYAGLRSFVEGDGHGK